MFHRVPRAAALVGATLVLALVASACSSASNPTPQVTPPPATETPNVTPTAETPETSPTPTEAPTATPAATGTPAPSQSPAVTPSASPSGPVCSGTAANQAFMTQAAKGLKFTVYCASKLGSHWAFGQNPLSTWQFTKSGGYVLLYYTYGKTATKIEVCEGAFSSSYCSGSTGSIGNANFAGMNGELDSTADGFAIYVASGTSHAYAIVGHNMSQATFVGIAANMLAVPKS